VKINFEGLTLNTKDFLISQGCGKTSLCKALAQKCAVRFAHRYEGVQLLEINAHSLFSKWFSEVCFVNC